MSRGGSVADLGLRDARFLDPDIPIVNLKADRVLQLCNPNYDVTGSEESFARFWTEIQELSHNGVFTLGIIWGCRRLEEASAFLQKSVKAGCRERYWKDHEKFNDYRATLTEGDDPGEWFELCQTDESRIGEAVLFYRYLYQSLQLREVQVSAVMSGVIFCMNVEGYDTKFLSSHAIELRNHVDELLPKLESITLKYARRT